MPVPSLSSLIQSTQINAPSPQLSSIAAQISRNNTTNTQTAEAIQPASNSGTGNSTRSTRRSGSDTVSVSTQNLQTRISELQGQKARSESTLKFTQNSTEAVDQIAGLLSQVEENVTKASSSGVSSTERALLQASTDDLLQQINALSQNTEALNFTVTVGEVADEIEQPAVTTSAINSTAASASLNFTSNLTNNQTVQINGVTFTAKTGTPSGTTQFKVGATLQETIDNLSSKLNANTSTNLTKASYARSGNNLVITARSAGDGGEQFIIDRNASSAKTRFTVTGDLVGTERYSLQGATDGDITSNDVIGTYTAPQANNVLVAQNVKSSQVKLNFANSTNVSNNQRIRIDNGNGGLLDFTFKTSANPANLQEIQIGSSLEDSIQNAVNTLTRFNEQYTGTSDYAIRQATFRREGTSLVIESEAPGAALDTALSNFDISETTAGTLSTTRLNNGTTSGVNTSGVVNEDFVGTISGFSATRVSNDRVNLSVTVGDYTYSAQVADTTPAGNTTVRLQSNGGGFFDIQLRGGTGSSVTNQAQADAYAARINSAFSTIKFTQDRKIDSFDTTAAGLDATFQLRSDDFDTPLTLEEVNVTSKSSSGNNNANFSLTINGEVFQSATNVIGGSIGARESFKLTSTTDPLKSITIKNGASEINLQTDADAASFKQKLEDGFGYYINEDVPQSYNVTQVSDGSAQSLDTRGLNLDALLQTKSIDLSSVKTSVRAQDTISVALETIGKVQSAAQSYENSVASQIREAEREIGQISAIQSEIESLESSASNGSDATEVTSLVPENKGLLDVVDAATRQTGGLSEILTQGARQSVQAEESQQIQIQNQSDRAEPQSKDDLSSLDVSAKESENEEDEREEKSGLFRIGFNAQDTFQAALSSSLANGQQLDITA